MNAIGRDPFVKVGLPTQSHPIPCHFGIIRHFETKLIGCFDDGRRIPVQSTKCPTLCAGLASRMSQSVWRAPGTAH